MYISPQRVNDQVIRQLLTVVGWSIHWERLGRAGRVPGGMIVLSREQMEQYHQSGKKHLESILKYIGTISKRTERKIA